MSRNDGVAGSWESVVPPASAGRTLRTTEDRRPAVDRALHQLIQQHPTFGYRRLWVLLRFRDGHRRESQGGVPPREAEAVVRASTVLYPTPAGARLGESGESEQRTVGDGCDAYSLWARWVGAFGGGDRLS
jgi:hypothetical protein